MYQQVAPTEIYVKKQQQQNQEMPEGLITLGLFSLFEKNPVSFVFKALIYSDWLLFVIGECGRGPVTVASVAGCLGGDEK